MKAETRPIPYGLKIIFEDGTVVNWYRDGRRRTVHAQKNPHAYRFPPADPSGEGILQTMNLSGDVRLRRLLGLPRREAAGPRRPTAAFDGGCSPNPGPGGWGVVLPDGRELRGGERRSTNNRMELTAAIRALEETRGRLHLVGDSAYVVNGATRWLSDWIRREWRRADGRPVENEDLWRRLTELLVGREVTWELVRGHSGHPLNERCDRLVALGREEAQGGS